jgi:hypothetical protein
MSSREIGLEKLKSLPTAEIQTAIDGLTRHVMARLRLGSPLDRTKSGAHCEAYLGVNPVQYYVSGAVLKLFDPDEGWVWQFERFDLTTQLIRIANSLISKKVAEYTSRKDELDMMDSRDVMDIPEGLIDPEENTAEFKELSSKLLQFVMTECSREFNLEYYATCFFNEMDKQSIADDMGLPKSDIELLHKKLMRIPLKFKSTSEFAEYE